MDSSGVLPWTPYWLLKLPYPITADEGSDIDPKCLESDENDSGELEIYTCAAQIAGLGADDAENYQNFDDTEDDPIVADVIVEKYMKQEIAINVLRPVLWGPLLVNMMLEENNPLFWS